jgi:hypothetical protein
MIPIGCVLPNGLAWAVWTGAIRLFTDVAVEEFCDLRQWGVLGSSPRSYLFVISL